uniref:RING-type domain-containing protein n=1 Tax=Panagrellus redivivus TaxID=6233 RepID=A0A7E4UWJ8_PANRE
MSEDEEINYFALAAERCFGRRQEAGPVPQAGSSNTASTPVQKNVPFNETPPTPTTNSDPPEPPSSVSSPEAPPKLIDDVIYLSSDDEDGETRPIQDSRGKRRSPPPSDALPFIKRRSSPSMTAKLEPFVPRALLSLNASDDPMLSPPETSSVLPATTTTVDEYRQCPTYRDISLAPVSCDHEALHSSQRSRVSQALTSAEKGLNVLPNATETPSRSLTPVISPESATPSPGMSFSEGEPSASTLRAMIANGFTPSQETLETEDTDTSPNSSAESIVDENENQIDEPSDNEEDADSDHDSGDDGSFGYRQDNAAEIEVFESDDEIEVLYDKFADAHRDGEPRSTDEADDAEPRSTDEADEPLQQIKTETGAADGNVDADEYSDDEDDNATIVISDDEEPASDGFDDEDASDTDSYRSVEIFTYDDPQYDWINPFLNENFAVNGLDGRERITEYLAGINENEYNELIGDRNVDEVIRDILEYMANTRSYQRGIRISRRLMELVEEEEEEPWLPSEKPKCLELFSADPTVKPEPPNTYPDDEPDVDGNAGII